MYPTTLNISNNIESTPVRLAARGRWLSILENLCPELEPALARPGRHSACPVHGGSDGFRLYRDAEVSGGGICNSCGASPDGFALLMWLRGWSFPDTLKAVASTLNGVSFYPASPKRKPLTVTKPKKQDDAHVRELLRDTWRASSPWDEPKSSLVKAYLQSRGLNPELLPKHMPFRFHPAMTYWEDEVCLGWHPAMLALVSGADGQPVTMHRTFLKNDGNKANLPYPKKFMPHPSDRCLTGGAVRLCQVESVIGIAEGIETALAVRQATGMAVWAALSCTLLERFEPPVGTRHVAIWGDLDRMGVGKYSAQKLAERLSEQGITASLHIPPASLLGDDKSIDWLDVLNRVGPAGFPSVI
jgi:putative DNA primase/helicase